MNFPSLTSKDLNDRKLNLPDDLSGQINLLFIAYQQWQQREVDSWVPFAQELEATVPGLSYYELPVVGPMGFWGRTQLDFWMRTGITDFKTRSKTITLYVDRDLVKRPLGIDTEDHIAIVLLDENNQAIWRDHSMFDIQKAKSLRQVIAQHTTINTT
ncbi:MAG: hypothetical protein AAF902_15495 [Chloroflexota bacterium]